MDRKTLMTGMLIVRDPKTHIELMVDSGSRCSVIPCLRPATHPSITGFRSCLNKSEVFTFESVELELTLNLARSFTWTFVKDKLWFATLGLDFLNYFGLLVDARRGRLVLPDENPVKPPYIFGDSRFLFCFICHIYPPFTRKRIVSLYFGREVRTRLGVAFFEVYGPPVFHIKVFHKRSSETVGGTPPETDCPSPPVCIDSEVTLVQGPKELFDRYSDFFDLEYF